MITGRVANREAIIEIEVAGPVQPPRRTDAVIDTGFNGYLTLPAHVITALQLPFTGHRRGTLANGSIVILDLYMATVVWHREQKDVLVSQADSVPLIGMSLLHGGRLIIDAVDGGDVIIEELPQQA